MYTNRFASISLRAAVLSLGVVVLPALADYNPVERASVRGTGTQVNGDSSAGALSSSADGRYVVFESVSSTLVSDDNNQEIDIFLRDLTAATTERVSISDSEEQADAASANPQVSADGRYVVFESFATNLIASDTNEASDIFLRDRTSETTTRVSVTSGGLEVDGDSRNPRISADGRYVVFESDATDLVAGDTNGVTDIFLHDTVGSTTVRVSLNTDTSEGDGASTNGGVSDDGAYVVFESAATDLVASDTNNKTDAFVHQLAGGVTTRISVNSTTSIQGNGDSGSPLISGDGNFVTFQSTATDLVSGDTNAVQDVFLYNRGGGGALTRISVKSNGQQSDGASNSGAISTTGQYIAFQSAATNLSSSDSNGVDDIFVHDQGSGDTTRVSVQPGGRQLDAASGFAALNSNANFITFSTLDSQLVSSDSNSAVDVFVLNLQCLVQPVGVVPVDTDVDATDDCADDCPLDPAKIVPGVCGCGVEDTPDMDSDGTADCIDGCETDPAKTEPGECGCGVAEVDDNGNGVSDCLDPTEATKPKKPQVLRYNRSKIRVLIPIRFAGVTYRVQLFKDGKRIRSKSGGSTDVYFRARDSGYSARYRILLPGGGRSKFSRTVEAR